MKTIHHATAAKAEKFGFILSGGLDDDHYDIHWPKKNRRFVGGDAPQLVKDMELLEMLTAEYPMIKVEQEKFESFEGGFPGYFITMKKTDEVVGTGDTLQDAWDEASEAMAPDADADEGDHDADEPDEAEEEDGEGSKSVVKSKYKKAYRGRPMRTSCSDDLAVQISRHVGTKDEKGKYRIDPVKLRKFAMANDCWNDRYAGLNVGMQRMNIRNRLQAKVNKGVEVIWG